MTLKYKNGTKLNRNFYIILTLDETFPNHRRRWISWFFLSLQTYTLPTMLPVKKNKQAQFLNNPISQNIRFPHIYIFSHHPIKTTGSINLFSLNDLFLVYSPRVLQTSFSMGRNAFNSMFYIHIITSWTQELWCYCARLKTNKETI